MTWARLQNCFSTTKDLNCIQDVVYNRNFETFPKFAHRVRLERHYGSIVVKKLFNNRYQAFVANGIHAYAMIKIITDPTGIKVHYRIKHRPNIWWVLLVDTALGVGGSVYAFDLYSVTWKSILIYFGYVTFLALGVVLYILNQPRYDQEFQILKTWVNEIKEPIR